MTQYCDFMLFLFVQTLMNVQAPLAKMEELAKIKLGTIPVIVRMDGQEKIVTTVR